MPKIEWDHTVHYVNDLEAVIEKFSEFGLIAFQGGSHEQWGTYNALSYFDLCYIEFLGVEDRAIVESIVEPNEVVRDSVRLLPENEVLSRVALRTDDIEAVVSHLSHFDLDMSPIMDGKRMDAQGNLIEWRMVTIGGDYKGLSYPFVIQWKGTDTERKERLIQSGIIQEHPAGKVSIREAVFRVNDPMVVAKRWQELFGFSFVNMDPLETRLSVGERSFIFKQGKENRLQQLTFETDANNLRGKKIKIGEGSKVPDTYRFLS